MLTCTAFSEVMTACGNHQVLIESLHDANVECFNKLIDGEFAFLEWRAKSDSIEVLEGADSLVVRDGKFRFQSIHHKVQLRE